MADMLDAVLALLSLRELSEILRFLVWLALVVLLGGILKNVYETTRRQVDDSERAETNEPTPADDSNENRETTAETNPSSGTE